MNIYYFDRMSLNYDNIHSFIMENFGKNSQSPSLKTPDFFLVQSNKNITNLNFIKIEKQKQFVNEDKNHRFYLETTVAFDNRHSKGADAFRQKIYPTEAIEKFCNLCGLETIENEFQDAQFVGCHIEKKFSIMNAFKIEGLFQVYDLNKFNQALTNGVGSRKSYGFGLIIVKEQTCHP